MSREAVLHALVDLTREQGYPPTFREVGERAGLTVASVAHHVNRLEADGTISRVRGRSRAIDVRPALRLISTAERQGTSYVGYCENCWAEISKKRPARFCSDACRAEAWKRDHQRGEA